MNHTSSTRKPETYHIFPVGYVRKENGRTVLDLLPAFAPALKELEHFSHVQVVWWFSQFEDEVYRHTTQFEDAPFDAPVLGVFACRSPVRPNPIGLTTARVLQVERNLKILRIPAPLAPNMT
jgi:tRNA (Thr-GGU) A37 N-methylase